ncbi:FkbO/Hyg5 family chorismatase [Streptomyces sp. NPDC050704]|uniref:FkbO/Hyg5 family chorismatase n=1 Tax=Streptomyces sp. NPDC050704 TaxID=3157219 RepID=UPI00342C7B26
MIPLLRPFDFLDALDDLDTIGTAPEPGAPLGVVRYTTRGLDPAVRDGVPVLDLPMVHTRDGGFVEVWPARGPVTSGERDGIVYALDGTYMFCAGRIAPAATYTKATRDAYLTALDLLAAAGYGSVFRMWNFIGDINADNAEGMEIYQDFCRGRAEAFESRALDIPRIPAATGVGSLGGPGIAFYLLAGRPDSTVHTGVENPLQLPAYHYPRRYGPKSPRFARATHVRSTAETGGRIYVSGTAGILGHESVHVGDVEAQCRVTLATMGRLLAPENLAAHGLAAGPRSDGHDGHDDSAGLGSVRSAKVYVRRHADLPTVRRLCERAFPAAAEVAYLTVDLCREELLVEIEAIADGT